MPSVSPIASYLRMNKAIPIRDEFGCHFYSPEGLYLGHVIKMNVENFKIVKIDIFGAEFKPLFSKSIAVCHECAYHINKKVERGMSIIPLKIIMRRIFTNFYDKTSEIVDTEKNLLNQLNLFAVERSSGTGLYEIKKPYKYSANDYNTEQQTIKVKNQFSVN